tara:strand:- start:194 stop:343 length:150 start_codon:yes stop_codon:yes gene_type:complete
METDFPLGQLILMTTTLLSQQTVNLESMEDSLAEMRLLDITQAGLGTQL